MKKYLITESQLLILLEQDGLSKFFILLSDKYPDSVYMMSYLKNFINKSGCKKISFDNIMAQGLSTTDGVVLNNNVFDSSFSHFLYVLFHEIAHQYQYKKYGIDKMYACYTGDMDIKDGAIWMKNVENIADEFAIRKIREIKKIFGDKININEKKDKLYDKISVFYFEGLIKMFIKKIKEKGYDNKNEIAQILYNSVKI